MLALRLVASCWGSHGGCHARQSASSCSGCHGVKCFEPTVILLQAELLLPTALHLLGSPHSPRCFAVAGVLLPNRRDLHPVKHSDLFPPLRLPAGPASDAGRASAGELPGTFLLTYHQLLGATAETLQITLLFHQHSLFFFRKGVDRPETKVWFGALVPLSSPAWGRWYLARLFHTGISAALVLEGWAARDLAAVSPSSSAFQP